MKKLAGLVVSAVMALFIGMQALPAKAAVAPAGIGKDLAATQSFAIEDVRWGGGGRRGWGHRGWGGHRMHARRSYYRPVHVRRYYGRPHRVRPAYYYNPRPVWRDSCIRRGWVWNGYRNVWRRYRVC